METLSQPHPATDLAPYLYYQVVHTLTGLLPPPLDDTPEALGIRNLAAIAKVAALLPVNANEADLAAQCIAARAQAEDVLRLVRQHAGFIELVIRLNAQYGSMVRTSLSVHARLMRVQAVRHKREAIDGAANEDAWARHIAERAMLGVVDPDGHPPDAVSPEQAPMKSPEAAPASLPEAAPATDVDQTIDQPVSEPGTNSQDTAFETWLSEQVQGEGSRPPDCNRLHQVVREAMAGLRSASPDLPADSR